MAQHCFDAIIDLRAERCRTIATSSKAVDAASYVTGARSKDVAADRLAHLQVALVNIVCNLEVRFQYYHEEVQVPAAASPYRDAQVAASAAPHTVMH